MAASCRRQANALAPLGDPDDSVRYGQNLKPPAHGVVRALLFRCAHVDARNIMSLLLFYTVASIIVAVNFYHFKINSIIDARVFITIVGIAIVLCRYIFVERQLLLHQAEIRANELEMRQDVYGPLAFLAMSLLRSGLLMWLLVVPNIAMTYFVVGLADNDAALGVLLLTLGLMNFVMMSIVTHLFLYGLAHRHVLAIVYFLEFTETYFAGVFVPIHYIASWASWFRFISPSCHALRVATITTLQSRADTCTAQEQLDGGVLGCFGRTANLAIEAFDLGERGSIDADVIALLAIFSAVVLASWLLLCGAQRHRLHHVAVDGELWVKHLRRSLHRIDVVDVSCGAGERGADMRGAAAKGASSIPPVSAQGQPDHVWPTSSAAGTTVPTATDVAVEMESPAQSQTNPITWISTL